MNSSNQVLWRYVDTLLEVSFEDREPVHNKIVEFISTNIDNCIDGEGATFFCPSLSSLITDFLENFCDISHKANMVPGITLNLRFNKTKARRYIEENK